MNAQQPESRPSPCESIDDMLGPGEAERVEKVSLMEKSKSKKQKSDSERHQRQKELPSPSQPSQEDDEDLKTAIKSQPSRKRSTRKKKESIEEEDSIEVTKEEKEEPKEDSHEGEKAVARSKVKEKTKVEPKEDTKETEKPTQRSKKRSQVSRKEKSVRLTLTEKVKSLIREPGLDEPPKELLKVVHVELPAGRPLDLVLSTNLVIRAVSKYSLAFYDVIVGDQIIEINDVAPMGIPEFLTIMHAEKKTLKLSILRAWNVQPPTETRMSWVKKHDNHSYFIVDVHEFKDFPNGFDVKFINKQCYVTKIDRNSRGAFAFLLGDKLLDIDSIPVNPTDIGDDAIEIGCREAMRYELIHERLHPISVLQNSLMKMVTVTETCDEEETKATAKRRRRRLKRLKKKGENRKIAIDARAETLFMPSDVKDDGQLQKVTPKSGLIHFVTSFKNVIAR
ncbi:hypothetical protein V3C99_010864 [Haemonchus contortus]